MISIIVAVAKNNVIGKDNKLIWHIPEDLKHFKNVTTGHTVIMGRKTFESLGRVLPNRKHIILCNDMELNIEDANVEVLQDISMLKPYIESEEENFVIGGATIYKLLMPYAKKLYVTHINEEFDGDVTFPEINKGEWKAVSCEKGLKDDKNPYDYEFVNYERIK